MYQLPLSTRTRLCILATLISLISLILMAPLHARGEPPRCTSDPECRNHLDQGVVFDAAQKYEDALKEFRAAYARKADPRVALNIGRTLHKLGRFAEALPVYQQASRSAPADTELQKELREYIAQAKQNLDSVSPSRPQSTKVEQHTDVLQSVPVEAASTAAVNNSGNNVGNSNSSVQVNLEKPVAGSGRRRSYGWLWGAVGLVVGAGAVGIAAAAAWPRPWQPPTGLLGSTLSSAATAPVGGAL